MNKFKKYALTIGISVCTIMSLCSCQKATESLAETIMEYLPENMVATLVQGNLDELYLNNPSAEYLELVHVTAEESEAAYLDGLEIEADYFSGYWGIIDVNYGESFYDLDETLQNDIIELLKEIYGYSKYELSVPEAQSDGSYAVKVTVSPIDIMNQAYEIYMNDEYEPLNDFFAKYADSDFEAMSDEDYATYTHEYGELIVQLVREQLPTLGYMDKKSQLIRVESTNDVFAINEDDLAVFDSYVIYYP